MNWRGGIIFEWMGRFISRSEAPHKGNLLRQGFLKKRSQSVITPPFPQAPPPPFHDISLCLFL